MEDSQIVELLLTRQERGLAEAREKYGAYCRRVAQGILRDPEDAEEIAADALLGAWDSIPPNRPERLGPYLARIVRNLALKRLRHDGAEKRGGGTVLLALEELEESIPAGTAPEEALQARELTEFLNRFLDRLPPDQRRVFLRRYWYFDSVEEIATRYGFGKSKVKMLLKRTRDRLRLELQKEDDCL